MKDYIFLLCLTIFQIMIMLEMLSDDPLLSVKLRWNSSRRKTSIII